MELPFAVSPVTGFPATVKPKLITLVAGAFDAAELTISQLCYDEQKDRLLFISVLDGVRHLVSYSAQSGVVWYVPVSGDLPHQARFTGGKIRLVSGTNVITRSADDGSLISSQSGFTGTSGIVRFDSRSFETGDLSGWTVESGGAWAVDNAHESLSGGHTGSWFVRSTGDGVLAQTVDVSSIARQIDLGGAHARARCWLRHASGCSFWMRATPCWA